jgi:hypothetical protein
MPDLSTPQISLKAIVKTYQYRIIFLFKREENALLRLI